MSVYVTGDCHGGFQRFTTFLEAVKERCQFSQWFCGHYHTNRVIDGRFVVQWERISRVEAEV